MEAGLEEYMKTIIGMNLEEANAFVKSRGYYVREIKRDGEYLGKTKDRRFNRVEVETIDGRIVSASWCVGACTCSE